MSEDTDGEGGLEGTRRHAGGRPRDLAINDAIMKAARERLLRDGYSGLTIGDVAADAGTNRTTLYRRWRNKLDLVIDALDYGFKAQQEKLHFDPTGLEPREALIEAIRRLDPAYVNKDATILVANLAGEAERNPELLLALRKHGALPRIAIFKDTIRYLQRRDDVSPDIDADALIMMCAGAYISAFNLGHSTDGLADRIAAMVWPSISRSA
jgi:AcrR family transcriptional regulator